MFENYSKLVMKHPKAIIAVWIVALLVSLPFAAQAEGVLNYDMTSMGGFSSESGDGQDLVDANFAGGLSTDMVVAFPYDSADEKAKLEATGDGSLTAEMTKLISDKYGDKASASIMGCYSKDDKDTSGVFLIAVAFNSNSGLVVSDETGTVREIVSQAKATAGISDYKSYVTGSAAITYDTLQGANSDVAKVDPISILLIILLLGLFFWTLVTALAPPLVVGTAYGVVLALTFALGQFLDIFYITKTIVLVSMLGAGCDYSIFIISRYREERKLGHDKETALTEAIKWAGESVFTSGLAVIIGFAVMACCSFMLIRTMAIVLALGIVLAMMAALTLVPAILAVVGDKIFWPRTIESYTAGSPMRTKGAYSKLVGFGKKYFKAAGRFSTKHAVPVVVAAILLTVPLGYVAFTSDTSFDMVSVMPDSEAKEGVGVMTDYADGGMVMPTYALMHLENPIATITPLFGTYGTLVWSSDANTYLQGISKINAKIAENDENVSYALGPTPWATVYQTAFSQVVSKVAATTGMTLEQATAYVNSNPSLVNKAILESGALPDAVTIQLQQFFTNGLDGNGHDAAEKEVINLAPTDGLTLVSGAPPTPVMYLIDYSVNVGAGLVSTDGTYVQSMIVVKDEPMSVKSMDSIGTARSSIESAIADNGYTWITGTWVLGTAAVLYDISDVVNKEFNYIEIGVIILIYVLLLVVLKAYFTPIRSLATIMMSVVWTLGLLHLVFGTVLAKDIVWIVPIVLFVICLGLGMDYDILVTTRIREGKMRGLSNDDAITAALEKSGPIITLCGLIMGGTFLTLLISGSAMLQEIGFALGFAILVDSLFVVPYVVPALMHLMGDWSWKGPGKKKMDQKSEN